MSETFTLYFVPTNGIDHPDEASGKTLELLPGYFVNPRQCGAITDVAEPPDHTPRSFVRDRMPGHVRQ